MSTYSYGLTWIDEDKLFEVTKKSFEKIIKKGGAETPPDIFTIVLQGKVTGESVGNMLSFERLRSLNKSISNAMGNWHQRVLSISPNWEDLGAAGGVVDLKTVDGFKHPLWDKPIYAEVKNRYNTIKSSDEKNIWDDLDKISRLHNGIGYVFQIIPEQPEPYDVPWRPSGRIARETVRACDGVTAYHMVFGYENALMELYQAFPYVLDDVIEALGREAGFELDEGAMIELAERVLPDHSAIC